MDSLDNNRSRKRPLAPATKQLLEALQRELLEKCALENKSGRNDEVSLVCVYSRVTLP
jgi:hypothetical protein